MICLTTVAERGVARFGGRSVNPAMSRGGFAASKETAALVVFEARILSSAEHYGKNRRSRRASGQWEIGARKVLTAKGQSYEGRDSGQVEDR